METIRLRLTGTSPLLQHNVRLVDPLDPYTIALAVATKVSGKSQDQHRTIARAEYEGSIYHSGQLGPEKGSKGGDPIVPSAWIMKSLRNMAALSKGGKEIERGVVPLSDSSPIAYQGPRDIDAMWNARMFDRRAVGVGQKRVMRTRPRFDSWMLEFDFAIVESIIDEAKFLAAAEAAGRLEGIGDARRLRMGRFEVARI